MKHATKVCVVLAGLLLIAILPSLAADQSKKASYIVVTSEELKTMLDQREPDLVIIDARNPEEFQEVHIQSAVNIPWSRLEKDKALLTFPKESKLVFYCNGFK